MKPPSAFKHSARAAWRKVADEAVILDTETAAYYSLSGAGLRCWELLGESLALPEIAAAVAEEYETGADAARKDLVELSSALRKELLLEPAEPREGVKRAPRPGRKKYRKPELVKHGSLSAAAGQTEDFSE